MADGAVKAKLAAVVRWTASVTSTSGRPSRPASPESRKATLVASPSTVTSIPVSRLTAAGPAATPHPMCSGRPPGSRRSRPAAIRGTVSAASIAKAVAARAASGIASASQVAKNASPT